MKSKLNQKKLVELREYLESTYCRADVSGGEYYDQLIDLWQKVLQLALFMLKSYKGE